MLVVNPDTWRGGLYMDMELPMESVNTRGERAAHEIYGIKALVIYPIFAIAAAQATTTMTMSSEVWGSTTSLLLMISRKRPYARSWLTCPNGHISKMI